MKAANEAAEPALARLSNGDWSLSDEERRAAAAWLTMLTMSYEFHDRQTLATRFTDRQFLMLFGLPPYNWIVLVAPQKAPSWAARIHHTGGYQAEYLNAPRHVSMENKSDSPLCNFQITVSTFGGFAFLTVGAHGEAATEGTHEQVSYYAKRLGFQQLWPLTTSFAQPDVAVTDTDMVEVADRLFLDLTSASGSRETPPV